MQISLELIGVFAGVVGAIATIWQTFKPSGAGRSQTIKSRSDSGSISSGDVSVTNGAVAAWEGSTVNILHQDDGLSDETRRRELRLALRTSEVDARQLATNLRALMQRADESRQRVMAATGQFRSGSMELWTSQLGEDTRNLGALVSCLPEHDQRYDELSLLELEERTVETHSIHANIRQLISKYQSAQDSDDITRQQILADATRRQPK